MFLGEINNSVFYVRNGCMSNIGHRNIHKCKRAQEQQNKDENQILIAIFHKS